VDGVGIVRYPDAVPGQLVPKSYRPRTGGRRRRGEGGDPLLQLLGTADQRLPDPPPVRRVQRREDLAAACVADGEPLPPAAGLPDPAPDRVERADARRRFSQACPQPVRRRDRDPQPRERAGTEPDREQVDRLPAAGGRGAALDLLEQGGRVPGAVLGGGPQKRLAENLAAAPGAGGGVLGRGIEADDDQRGVASRP